jgi:hypothetical protein
MAVVIKDHARRRIYPVPLIAQSERQGLELAAAGMPIADVCPHDWLRAVAHLCRAGSTDDPAQARLLVSLLVDGLRFRAF